MNGTTHKIRRHEPAQVIADFAETTHVPTTYINNTLSAVGSHSQISSSVHALLEDLEVASAAASEKLNMLVDDMLRTAPRLGYDIEVLRGELQTLHTTATKIEPKRDALAGKGQAAIKKLASLEHVKLQMQHTQKVFEEAQAWKPPESIEEPIYALIAASEFATASKEVLRYEGLLQIYKGTSEYARRKAVMDRVRKRLLDVKQDGSSKISLELARTSVESQRSSESTGAEDGYYSSFIKRAFKS